MAGSRLGTSSLVAASAVLALMVAACSSISGKKLVTCPDGSVRMQDVGGLPIVVQTPNRAVFILTESVYSVQRVDVDASGVVQPPVSLPDEVQTTISQQPIFLGPSEIYTIDPLRPFAGSLDYGINLNDRQYPTSVSGRVVDTTVTDIGAIVQKLVEKFAPPKTPEPQAGPNLIKTLKVQKVKLVIVDLNTGAIEVKEV
jgi:hypothetical protein